MSKDFFELEQDISQSSLYNKDLAPVPIAERNWNKWHIASIWVGMAVCIPTYMMASSLISQGMNWWQALFTILLGNVIVLIPMVLNAHVGTKYGVPLPVFLRLSFGIRGAVLASLLRALVACGWFGIQTWIGGAAIYQLLLVVFPSLANSPYLGTFIGLNTAQAMSFLFFWAINIYIIYKGIHSIKLLEVWSAPFLLIIGLCLLIWAWIKVGSMTEILAASNHLSNQTNIDFWKILFPGLTAMVGFWATLSLNIPDFTRYAKSQREQALGQLIGLPTTMAFYSFIGIAVTSATLIIYGEAIWDPVALMAKFKSPLVVVISMFGLTIATLSTNIAANVVAPANSFANMAPRKINFKLGGYITGILGILIFPWKLIADPEGYIFRWLIAYSALLGSLAGIMICDYYIVRKTQINLAELFNEKGIYKGWNKIAWLVFVLSLVPVIPGFLVAVGLASTTAFPQSLVDLYSYAWFITFGISFILYAVLMKKK